VIARALAKDASDRYPTIRAFAAALTPFAVGVDTSHWSRPPPPMNPVHAPVDRTGSKPSLETATTLHVRTTQQSRASGRLLWLGGAALAVVVLGGAFALGAARQASNGVDAEPRASEQPSATPEPTSSATAVAAAPTSEPLITPSSVASAASAKVEKPIRTGAKVTPSATDKPVPPKTAPTGGPLPTRL
jgi:hypothetical protein